MTRRLSSKWSAQCRQAADYRRRSSSLRDGARLSRHLPGEFQRPQRPARVRDDDAGQYEFSRLGGAADAPGSLRSRGIRRGEVDGQLQEFCELKRTTSSGATLLAELAEMGRGGTAFGVVTAGGRVLARLLPEKVDALLGDVSELERKLDVVVLHELVLNRILGVSPEAVREQRNVRYLRSAEEAVEQVNKGANAAFLLNPVSLNVMRDLCYAGRVMPQKSTDFYPKLLSGFTLDNLDQCF